MAYQLGTTLRTNQASQLQTTIGSSPILKIWSGAEPSNCAASDPTGLLCTITLPATFLTSSGGVATLAGTWAGTASATGTAATIRIYDSTGTTCHIQGNATDFGVSPTSITSGQPVSVTSFVHTMGNA